VFVFNVSSHKKK